MQQNSCNYGISKPVLSISQSINSNTCLENIVRDLRPFIPLLFLSFFIPGCATMLKGYEDTVNIRNPSDSLQVFTMTGDELAVTKTNKRYKGKFGIVNGREILLRTDREHTLIIRSAQGEKKVTVYPKLWFGWVALDLLCGGLPSFYDAYTGCWNTFDDIDAAMP